MQQGLGATIMVRDEVGNSSTTKRAGNLRLPQQEERALVGSVNNHISSKRL